MSKISNIEIANQSTQTVAVGNEVSLGNIVRRYSCSQFQPFELIGNELILRKAGYYRISFETTYQGSEVGTATIGIYANGTLVPYSQIQETVGAVTDVLTDSMSTTVRVLPNAPLTISIRPISSAVTFIRTDLKGTKIV